MERIRLATFRDLDAAEFGRAVTAVADQGTRVLVSGGRFTPAQAAPLTWYLQTLRLVCDPNLSPIAPGADLVLPMEAVELTRTSPLYRGRAATGSSTGCWA